MLILGCGNTEKLRLSALNSTKTAYTAFVLDASEFFDEYSFTVGRGNATAKNAHPDRFCCQIYLKVSKHCKSCDCFPGKLMMG